MLKNELRIKNVKKWGGDKKCKKWGGDKKF